MGKMFDMDNPVWRFMGKVTDMFFRHVCGCFFTAGRNNRGV